MKTLWKFLHKSNGKIDWMFVCITIGFVNNVLGMRNAAVGWTIFGLVYEVVQLRGEIVDLQQRPCNSYRVQDQARFRQLQNLMPSSHPLQAVAHERRYGEEYRALKKKLGLSEEGS